ncbi:MAG: cupin domain-containing protein [Nocardioidaceae bacterium]|nr:MAG: cupin domain-containing protein [Nocardioidaceae bacterium]
MHIEPQRLKVVRSVDLTEATSQTQNALRRAGVSQGNTDASRIWLGKVHTPAGYASDAHHHGEAETAGYVLKGRAFILHGDGYRERIELEEGDFIFVPPNTPHIEGNCSDTEELIWMTARTPDNIVVNLENPF